jgi:phosphonate transport system substrate-binding protein
MKWLTGFLWLFVVFNSHASDQGVERQEVYSFGVVPQFDARHIYSVWRPILDELQQRTGMRFTLRGSVTIPAFEEEFGGGEFDFAYMNPYQVVKAGDAQGYQPVVRDVGRQLHGIVVVAKDGPVKTVEQLTGKEVAFPAPGALGATLLVRSELQQRYKIDVKPRFVQTHSSVYLNVAMGEVAAGGGVQKTFEQQSEDVKNALQVVYRTQKVAPHPVVAHPRVSPEQVKKVHDAFVEMGKDEKGREMLSKIPVKMIGSASMLDYEPLKKMHLERFH